MAQQITTEAGITASVTGTRRENAEIVVRLAVSGGTRRVNGEAQMAHNAANPMQWEPSGQSLDAWLSGGIIALLDEYTAEERDAAIDDLRDLAHEAARNYDDETDA